MFAPSMLMACGGLVRDALVLGALVQGREGRSQWRSSCAS